MITYPLPIEPVEIRLIDGHSVCFYWPQQIEQYLYDHLFDTDDVFFQHHASSLAFQNDNTGHRTPHHHTGAV